MTHAFNLLIKLIHNRQDVIDVSDISYTDDSIKCNALLKMDGINYEIKITPIVPTRLQKIQNMLANICDGGQR